MALILDESFVTGIPASFATLRQQAGTLTETYDAAAQAVDLSNATAGQNIYDITSVPLSVAGEMEIDLEFVSNAAGTLGFGGAWPVARQAAVSNGFRFAHNGLNYEVMPWTGATSWAGNGAVSAFAHGADFPFATAGDRRIFNVRWDMSAGAGVTRLAAEFRVDGLLVLGSVVVYPSLAPGVTLYQSTVRLHGIKVWDAPQAALTAIAGRRLGVAGAGLGVLGMAPPEAMDAEGLHKRSLFYLTQNSVLFDGTGRITGTVKEKGTPTNTPLRRRVNLIDEATRQNIRETWSDVATGAYSFDYVDMTRRYTVLSYDHTGAYRAVVADRIVPELIP